MLLVSYYLAFMPSQRLKTILRRFTILLTLVIIGVTGTAAYGIFHFEEEIQKKLELKKILKKTEYYAASQKITVNSQISGLEIEKLLEQQNYRRRAFEQSLQPGDFQSLTAEQCYQQKIVSAEQQPCLILRLSATDSKENTLKPEDLIYVVWNSAGRLTELKVNLQQPLNTIFFKPTLVAQYVGADPVLQNEVPLSQVPALCSQAVISIEDNQFLQHSGVSIKGLFRALAKNVTHGRAAQGGSTITQQLVKNYFLTSEKTLKRKAQELLMSLLLEKSFTKDQILETYFNIIYMGQNGVYQVRGYGAAAPFYFNKSIESLNLSECALLAAIVNSPGLFNPFKNSAKALQRRNLVLQKMQEQNFISAEELKQAQQQTLPAKNINLAAETAPYYLDAVYKQLKKQPELLEASVGGKIYMGLDLQYQQVAQTALANHLAQLEKDSKKIKKLLTQGYRIEGMVLVVDNSTGLILTAIGGRDFRKTQFNRSVDSHRQIGSLMKPLVYLTALDKKENFSATTILPDEKFTTKYDGQSWSPDNYDKKYFGPIPAYFALMNSLNSATAKLGLDVGLDNIISTAQKLGITSVLQKVPSLTLGAFELYPVEVAKAYMTLALLGQARPVSFIRKIVNEEGQVIFEQPANTETVFNPEVAGQLVSMMKQTVIAGTARSIHLQNFAWPAAGKTGTTSDNKDAWFAGFTPQKTTVVWVGYDKNQSHGLTGSSAAVPVWLETMKTISVHDSQDDFNWPKSLKQIEVQLPEKPESPSQTLQLQVL
ncbi:MAG: transglycosylase domain-containing protein [Pseudobdellovibrionaceae bacterium]